jgi:transcriptional antiterminator RfaH
MTNTVRWYVAQTQPRAEAKAAVHLCRQGFSVYLPRYLKRRRHARRIELIGAPLFPGYIFVAMNVTFQRWRAIQSTVGVSRLVCNGDRPAPVADCVIEGLKRGEDDSGFVKLERRSQFKEGDKIRVVDGVFGSCFGLFEGTPDRERVAILLNLLGRSVRVVLDAELVAAA